MSYNENASLRLFAELRQEYGMRTAALDDASNPAIAAPWARRTAAAAPARERGRRRFVGTVLLIYLLLIFEGSLRKWVVPEFGLYVFFIRDPFLLYAYFLAFQHRLWPKRSVLLGIFVAMATIGVVLGVVQLLQRGAGTTEALLTIYGWRNYFLYPPLALLVGAQFQEKDLARLCRWTLLLSVPIGALVALQFFSPHDAPINVGIASEAQYQFAGFGQTAERTRPMGTFSSGAGQNQFVASAFALLLGLIMTPRRARATGALPLWLGACGVATCLAFGGSRGAMLHCVLIVLFCVVLSALTRGAAVKLRGAILPLLLAGFFAVLYPVVFRDGYDAFSARWNAAASVEQNGILLRALYDFVDFTNMVGNTPALGYGLGMGGNAAAVLDVRAEGQRRAGALAETDWSRHIVDLGPAFGVLYILLRVSLVVWLAIVVFRAMRRGAAPWLLPLFGYVAHPLLLGQITGQGAINGYAWLFLGLTLAAAASRSVSRPAAEVGRRGARRRPR